MSEKMGREVSSGGSQSSMSCMISGEAPNTASSAAENDWAAQKHSIQSVEKQKSPRFQGSTVDSFFRMDEQNSGHYMMTDEQRQGQPQVLSAMQNLQVPYLPPAYQPDQMIGSNLPMPSCPLPTPNTQSQLAQQQLSLAQIFDFKNDQQAVYNLDQQLRMFWASQYQEVVSTVDFKHHALPLARIKKIMKADEDVRMIAAEAPVLFARACEMFILELTYRAWALIEENRRRTLQKSDIAGAISRTEAFDFLGDIVPREETKEEVTSPTSRASGSNDSLSYYYMPPSVGPMGMMMGRDEMEQSMMYLQQPPSYMPHQFWSEQQQRMIHKQSEHKQQPSDES